MTAFIRCSLFLGLFLLPSMAEMAAAEPSTISRHGMNAQRLFALSDFSTPPEGAFRNDERLERTSPSPFEPAESDASDKEPSPGPVEPAAILYDFESLPEPARRMRQLIVEAAKTGDIEALRPLIGSGPTATRLAPSAMKDDPIDYLASSSGDAEGREILAILLDVLDAGFIRTEPPGEAALYLWPYFPAMALEDLSAAQEVELLRIVTAGDLAEMRIVGAYNFYQVGITESGEWRFFVSGH